MPYFFCNNSQLGIGLEKLEQRFTEMASLGNDTSIFFLITKIWSPVFMNSI